MFIPIISSSDSVAKMLRRSEAAAVWQGGQRSAGCGGGQAVLLQWGCSVTPGCQAGGNGFKEHLY